MNIVAVIPARGGSKGLPRKNILPVKGKPLIIYTIEQALSAPLLSRIIVSTDDNEIAEIAKQAGAEVPFLRPKELATDTAHTGPVLEHTASFLEERNYPVNAIVTLQPNCPLRTPHDIDEVIKLYKELGCDTLMSVSPAKTAPWSVWVTDEKKDGYIRRIMKYPTGENPANLERQQLIPAYEANGIIYITNREYLRRTGNWIHPENCGYYMMGSKSYVDVDSEYDLRLLELVMDKVL